MPLIIDEDFATIRFLSNITPKLVNEWNYKCKQQDHSRFKVHDSCIIT